MKKPFLRILIPPSAIAILFSSKVLLADTGFTGPYAPSNFTLTNSPSGSHNGSVNTSGAPSYVSITGPDDPGLHPSVAFTSTTSYTATAGYTGVYSFNWSYSSVDIAFYDYPNFINGSSVTLFSGFNNGLSGSSTQSGTGSYTITNGTTFGFQIYSFDTLAGAAKVDISNFVWPSLASTDITVVGSPYLAMDLITTVNPTFDGGTLEMNEAVGSYAYNFSLSNSATNTIDQFGNTSTFSGVFSDTTTSGKISIKNTGTANQGSVTFSGINTYTGTTSIASGSTLDLSGSGSIAASSGLANNGTFDISGTTSGASIKSLSGSGSLVTDSGKDLTLTNAADIFSGVMSGAGGLTLSGGDETLSGINT